MEARIDVEVTAPVFETELEERVATAIQRLFPGADPTARHGELAATVHSLEHLSELLHRQEILDTARGVFLGNRRGDGFSFRLKKQAALQGVVNFVTDEPGELGAITVRVRVEGADPEAYIDHVAPPTEGGEPVTV